MKLLLVDGSNMVMRAAFGGDIPPLKAAPIATGLILRAARMAEATHMIVALDSPTPSWRKTEFPDYKAQRTRDTTEWLRVAFEEWTRLGWFVEATTGYEADDIIATIAHRALVSSPPGGLETSHLKLATPSNRSVIVCSSDSDLLTLAGTGVDILKPVNGGRYEWMDADAVCAKYKIARPSLLVDYKSLTGESGDNIPGVPGIGPVRSARLLESYGTLEDVIRAGEQKQCPGSMTVFQNAARARRAFRLISLSTDAPIPPVKPSLCRVNS